eukprot:scaffold14131_cov64-Phaeocystis_antarctica.AAC.2
MGRRVNTWPWKDPVRSDLDHAPTERPLRRAHCQKVVLTTAAANVHPSPPHLVGRKHIDEADTRRRTSADGADGPSPVTCSAPHAGRLGRRSRQDHRLQSV